MSGKEKMMDDFDRRELFTLLWFIFTFLMAVVVPVLVMIFESAEGKEVMGMVAEEVIQYEGGGK